ncbi:hypothetical protein RJ640_009644 [Escallonia rubra]|uniref:Uncharacterized protein n=1 Tax=Escallonia rubra TaxID=112253 RepID=A0AA88RRX8_9ASTE|nr:hypothetical protein RJ640_009644 [Escallonia rubra]
MKDCGFDHQEVEKEILGVDLHLVRVLDRNLVVDYPEVEQEIHTRIYILHDLLGKISRDSKTISEYLHEIFSLANELATAKLPISNEELVVEILRDLGPEFCEISATIRARDNPILYGAL